MPDRQMVFLGSVITGDNLDIYFRLRRPLHRLPFPPSRGGKSAESIIIPDVAYDPGESDSSFSLSPFTPLALFSVWLREALRIRKPTKGKRQSKKVVPQILVKGLPTEERQILNMNIKSGRLQEYYLHKLTREPYLKVRKENKMDGPKFAAAPSVRASQSYSHFGSVDSRNTAGLCLPSGKGRARGEGDTDGSRIATAKSAAADGNAVVAIFMASG